MYLLIWILINPIEYLESTLVTRAIVILLNDRSGLRIHDTSIPIWLLCNGVTVPAPGYVAMLGLRELVWHVSFDFPLFLAPLPDFIHVYAWFLGHDAFKHHLILSMYLTEFTFALFSLNRIKIIALVGNVVMSSNRLITWYMIHLFLLMRVLDWLHFSVLLTVHYFFDFAVQQSIGFFNFSYSFFLKLNWFGLGHVLIHMVSLMKVNYTSHLSDVLLVDLEVLIIFNCIQ